MVSVTSLTLIVGVDTFVSLMQTWHSRVGALRAHSIAPQFHHLTTGTYLLFWLMILPSTAKCDRPPDVEDPSNFVTQNDITDVGGEVLFHNQKKSFTLRSSGENGENPFLKSQPVLESTNTPLTQMNMIETSSSPSPLSNTAEFGSDRTTSTNSPLTETNMIKTSSSPSPLSNTAEFGSDSATSQSDVIVDDRTMTDILLESKQTTGNLESENSDFPLTTNFPPTTLSIENPCDIDQLVVSDNPVQVEAFTNATECSLLVTTEKSTAISVTLLKSNINNVYTYFYIESLDQPTQKCPDKYLLVSGSHIPCKVIIQGNKFRFHFQNTEMMLEIRTENVEMSSCYDTQTPLIGVTACNVTSYQSEIQWSRKRQSFRYGFWVKEVTVNVVQYHAMCTCDCADMCMCTLGYREWLSTCIDRKGSNTTKAYMIVYSPSIQGLSFVKSNMHMIQQHAFLGLEGLKVLILSHNILTTLPPTVCQNLPGLQILKIDNNKLANLTSDMFQGRCEQQLLLLNLSNNEITNLPHDLFHTTSNLTTLDLRHNRLIQLFTDLFASLKALAYLYLNGNNIATLPAGVFKSLNYLNFLYLQENAISTLPQGVFDSLDDLLFILDLSGNYISTLPQGIFASVGGIFDLNLSSNDISTLPQGVFDSLGDRLQILDLSGNYISILPQGVFDSLEKLLTLDLSGNNISTLPQGVFASPGSLWILDLSGNYISILPQGVFASLERLFTLDLSGNYISILLEGVFASLGRLWTLDLSGNYISTLPQGVFVLLGTLYTLDLSGSTIHTLPNSTFATLVKLKSLDLSHNNISHISSGAVFGSLFNLITLDLSHNVINTLPHDTFKSQKELLTLDLSYNHLLILPNGLFKTLTKLKLLELCGNNMTLHIYETFDALTGLKVLNFGNSMIKRFSLRLLGSSKNLESLDISENALETISHQCFTNLSKLVFLNMSRNLLSQLPSFNAQTELQVLDLSENMLNTLKSTIFISLKELEFLSLCRNYIVSIPSQTFHHLYQLTFINISFNAIEQIDVGLLSKNTRLHTIDLRGNDMRMVKHASFQGTTNSTIIVDRYAICCFMDSEKCVSLEPQSEYLTCNRMLQNVFLRISVWILGLSAFTCNIIAYFVRSRKKQAKKVQTLFISHLALSDLLMGVNMLLLAVGDVYYGEYFPSYSHSWRHGFACKFAGFLSILSCEGSVFFITLISIDRLLGIKYPFGDHNLTTKMARFCVLLAWLAVFLIGAIPIGLATNKEDVFSISEVCIGIPIVRRNIRAFENNSVLINVPRVSNDLVLDNQYRFRAVYSFVQDVNIKQQQIIQNIPYTVAQNSGSQIASIYSIVVFIGVNLVCFLTVSFCYIYLFITATKTSQNATRPQDQKDEIRMAKKMFAIIFTDFCCWVPLSFICILAQCGVLEISPEMYAWTVGFILPINSSINPFLYVLYETISDHLKKKEEERKARETREMKTRWKPLIQFGLRFDEK